MQFQCNDTALKITNFGDEFIFCMHITPLCLQRIFNQWATTKLLTFIASCSPRKTLQFYVWQLVVCHFLPELFTVDYLKCFLLNGSAGIRARTKESDIPFSLKNIDSTIRLHGGRAECCINWNIYTKLALIVNFKWNACKKWTSSLKLVVILSAVLLDWNCAKNI